MVRLAFTSAPAKHTKSPTLFLLAAALPLWANAACPDEEAVTSWVAAVAAAQPHPGFGEQLSDTDADCARRKVVAALPSALGSRVGYKAAFTSADVQKRFAVEGPAWAVMFDRFLLNGGGIVPASLGTKLLYEADLVAVVGSPKLADAKTAMDALEHIEAFMPFIELPDLMLEGKPTGNALVATNVAFRGGVLGSRVSPGKGQQGFSALGRMTVIVEENGKPLAHVPGTALMEHPLNAALWLARSLRAAGIELERGDLLSLGGYTAPRPATPGTTVTVRYKGLAGEMASDSAVSVRFE